MSPGLTFARSDVFPMPKNRDASFNRTISFGANACGAFAVDFFFGMGDLVAVHCCNMVSPRSGRQRQVAPSTTWETRRKCRLLRNQQRKKVRVPMTLDIQSACPAALTSTGELRRDLDLETEKGRKPGKWA